MRTGDEATALSNRSPIFNRLWQSSLSVKGRLALGMAWFAIGKSGCARRQLEQAAELELDPTNTII